MRNSKGNREGEWARGWAFEQEDELMRYLVDFDAAVTFFKKRFFSDVIVIYIVRINIRHNDSFRLKD